MLKILQGFCLVILYVGVVDVTAQSQPEYQISLTTLKSDLNLILEDPSSPRTVNIWYAPYAVLHLLVVPKLGGAGGRNIEIDGTVHIKQKKTPIVERTDLVYQDGSFGLPLDQEDTTYIIIKSNTGKVAKAADKTLNYDALSELKNRLHKRITDLGWPKIAKELTLTGFEVGSRFSSVVYKPEDDRMLFQEPLKGIALYREDKFNVRNLVKPRTYKTIKDRLKPTSPGSGLLGGFRKFVSTKEPDALLTGFSQLVTTKRPDVFFDVWYELKSGRMCSSSGSLDDIDAVRVYEESVYDMAFAAQRTVDTSVPAGRGEYIRQRTLEQDMYDAYKELFDPSKRYKNAIINYADEIVLEVRPGGGDNRFVSAAGTTYADEQGSGPYNVRAYYNINRLDYSGTGAGEERFVPLTDGEKSWYLKYSDWGRFERHLRAIWAAMQGGCNQKGKLFYDYRIFYGGSILVRYYCKTRSIVLEDTISVLTRVPSFHQGAITKCSSLRYAPTQQLEMPCLHDAAPPIAIRQEPEELWIKYYEPISISTAVLKHEMVMLQEALVKNAKSRKNTLTQGAIILDEYLLLAMKHPKGENRRVKVYLHDTDYTIMNFHGGELSTKTGVLVNLMDAFTTLKNEIIGPEVAEQYVIGAKYVTIKKLREDLQRVSEEGWSRCTSRKVKNFSFMLVHHRRFAFHGYYDCTEKVFLVEGTFGAFITDRYGGTKIQQADQMILDFVYVENDKFFMTDGLAFDEVYAISVPEANLDAAKKSYGAPIHLDEHTFILFKSRGE